MSDYYYAKDIAKLLNIDIKSIYGQIKRGKIPQPKVVRVGHSSLRQWQKDEIDIWLAKKPL